MTTSFAKLFDPNERYPYFSQASEHPFEAQNRHFSLVNAGWLADCALLAYLRDASDVETRLQHDGGFNEAFCIGFEEEGAQCFVARRNEGTVVSFRGTEIREWEDIKADVNVVLEPIENSEAKVHLGFLRSLETIWPQVMDTIGDEQKIWFTGHSLGAALATLAADRYPNSSLYTFGSPRVGDKKFRQSFHANAYRFVNNNDGVTAVPFPPYRHVGDLKYLDQNGQLVDNANWWQRIKTGLLGIVEGGRDTAIPDALVDHSPTHYAEHVWNNIDGSR
ncbi:MAG: lipase family protein [Gammaproteobacteria bacterium]|nr:lipase family protein [Gammaproteobacteria bacterium]